MALVNEHFQHWNCAWQMRALRPMMITESVARLALFQGYCQI